jgi:hypothetical protein
MPKTLKREDTVSNMLVAAGPVFSGMIAQMESEDGWVRLSAVGTQLANLAPTSPPRVGTASAS